MTLEYLYKQGNLTHQAEAIVEGSMDAALEYTDAENSKTATTTHYTKTPEDAVFFLIGRVSLAGGKIKY